MNPDHHDQIRIGICGLGTVGGGTYQLLKDNRSELTRRLGKELLVTHVASRSEKPQIQSANVRFSNDVFAVARDPQVDVLVETIGGFDPAL
ncbi:MAG: homoserine dehydrogenase, partial [Gammaproteobacteria bacterium]|nr:homoserine dehydrogenase [Gammaproteobacteria bacterium]